MIKKIFVLVSILLSLSCSCNKDMKRIQHQINNLDDFVNNNFHKKYKVIYNSTKEYALILKERSSKINDVVPTISYSIIQTKSKIVVYKDVISGGIIKWLNDYKIVIQSIIEKPKDLFNSSKQKVLYKLNVKTLKKSK